ncbi:MAG: alpha/beta hydrolase [Chloroflexota bacterium]
MVMRLDQQVILQNGKKLGYAEFGDAQGQAVLHFHGMPSSRMEGNRPAIDEIATRLGARILVVERPGVGLSDFWPYRIVDWPDITLGFADQMGLERFAVIGLSSGGKYVAACAWKMPPRLRAACIISGNAPVEITEVHASMSAQDRQLYWLARHANGALRLLLGKIAGDARKDPNSVLSLFSEVSAPDQAALQQADIQKVLQGMVSGAFQSGTRGVAWDWKLEALPWGFNLSEIEMPVVLWHGEEDRLVPPAHGHYMAKALPDCQAHFVPAEGHVSLIARHYEEILKSILN